MRTPLYLGKAPLHTNEHTVCGQLVTLEGQPYYQIANYDRMPPFFMTVVSDSDHWLFISSNGGLTAGRRDANLALFPYYTDDKIRDMAEVTGSKTLLRVQGRGKQFLWEPFSARCDGIYRVRRNLYKNFCGNQLLFEEINDDLSLTFRYGWFNSREFGFVRRAWLASQGSEDVRVAVLDGVQNLMPCGAASQFNLEYSTLLDAYKKSELLAQTGLGIFRLSAIPVDRPEPAESLRANLAWSVGLKRQVVLLSSVQVDRFRRGEALCQESGVRAERGAYFVQSEVNLSGGQSVDWLLVADVNQGSADVARIGVLLSKPAALRRLVLGDVLRGTQELRRIVGTADGLQQTARALGCARHYSNTLFNVMRGGVFQDGYRLSTSDLMAFVRHTNAALALRHSGYFEALPLTVIYGRMVAEAVAVGDPQLERVCREYLPLTFSRRHGDPSRPWNRFSIATRNRDGTPSLNYEGNWRDIFQNWEALALSFPGYTAGMICRFLNASTADGYNPYRITRHGIDWEVVDSHDPWSYIGYWGDHQIIYLLKLLEQLDRHEPEALAGLLNRGIFAYANVPYRIKPFESIRANPKDTVVFDAALDKKICQRVQETGSDGKLVWDKTGQVRLVNLAEKLLVPLLAKLSNFIPGAGIWLNTQRPEWNDANNALVGNGTSMVTLYYLRRYLTFCRDLFAKESNGGFALSAEVAGFAKALSGSFEGHESLLLADISDVDRQRVAGELGRAGSQYREALYAKGFSGRKISVPGREFLSLFNRALDWTNHSIQSNRRPDGLYHSYNLIRLDKAEQMPVRRLYEMLEGQVAVLSSGYLSAAESLALLRALKSSAIYRAAQHSYLLYPDRDLPRFVERNNIPPQDLAKLPLLQKLLSDGNGQLVERDVLGAVHFHSSVTNGRDLERILESLPAQAYGPLVKREAALILALFERLFDHESFTGRSGTFFGYEGLGCIYWHMVSKLLLAVQESYLRAVAADEPVPVLEGLAEAYHDVRTGLGDYKTPEAYGAFPMDAYSHTPGHGGARQPGLTGQVKEDVLCRMGELGVSVGLGQLGFAPRLLRRQEFMDKPYDFHGFDFSGKPKRIRLPAGSLAFTFCQTLVVYQLADRDSLTLVYADDSRHDIDGLRLSVAQSQEVFGRSGKIERILVHLKDTRSRWP